MRSTTSLLTSGAALALVLSAGEARPCGGAFGYDYTISPAQSIVVGYRDGIETYIFNPSFCGKASDFGLILPVPGLLSQTPALHKKQLYTDLADIAAPTINTTSICSTSYHGPGRGVPAGTGGSGSNGGTTVIQKGTVGVFDYALLQADSTESFTDWLDNNGFPYEDSAEAVFEHYVENRWYFVAFKVSTGANSGETGGTGSGGASGGSGGAVTPTICGDFGPISLSFPVESNPVVPARIAAVSSSSLTWTVYTLAEHQLKAQDLGTELRFSGALTGMDLAHYPEVAKIADEGTRLTELRVTISVPDNDLVLEPNPAEADFRRVETQTVYVECTGGGGGTGGAAGAGNTPEEGGSAGSSGGPSVQPETGGQSSEDAGSSSTDAPHSGGSIGTGGVQATGGTPRTPSSDGKLTGGVGQTGDTPTTGGGTVEGSGGVLAATGGAETSAAAGTDTGAEGPSIGSDGEGCSCKTGGSRTSPTPRALIFAVFAGALAAGRRRRPGTPKP
jgi:MYXO-CTERM domain-containing protein